MRRAFDQADRTAAGAQRLPFFPIPRVKILHRQSLTGGLLDLSAAVADGEFPYREPIGDRAPIAERDIHRAERALDKLRSELGLVVVELQVDAESGLGGPLRGDFPFPFWIRQVPKRFELFRVDELGIVRQAPDAAHRDIDDDELVLGVREDMLAAVPFGLVEHFGKYKR